MKKTFAQKPPSIDFDLRQLEIFRKVVELGSFSRAAEAVFLAQASVSERVATLESMVGTKLLDRLGRKITPTRAGELLYKHSVLLLEMKKTAVLELQEFLGLQRGGILIGGSTIPGEYILPKYLGRFRKKYPMVSVALTISDSRKIETGVLRGKLELGVVGSKSTDANLVSRDLWEDELVLVVPADHPWAGKKEISADKLFSEPFILREEGSGTLGIMKSYLQQAKHKGPEALQVVTRVGSSTAVKEAIKAGLGVSILSSRAVQTEVEGGLLKPLRVKALPMKRSFYLIRDKRRIASPLCQAMTEFLLDASAE